MCVLIHFCMGRRTDEYVLFYHQLRRGILLLLRMESLRSEYKHALAVALSEFDGGFDGIRWYVVITQQHDFYIIWCSLISQHEGILLYLIIKSIKATSMLERLDGSWLWLHGGGCTVCWYLLSLPPCSPRMSDVHFIVHLQIYHGGEILLISSFES